MSFLISPNAEFEHIIRIYNTNISGKRRVGEAISSIKGIGKRMAAIIIKKADIDPSLRAGELCDSDRERLTQVISSPKKYNIPYFMFNRQRDRKTGKHLHLIANMLDEAKRTDLERKKKIRCHKGLRHSLGLRVRGQHTKTTGRRGKTVGVSTKK